MTAARPMSGSARIHRSGYGLSGAAVIATLFVFAPSTDAVRLVTVPVAVVGVLLVIAVLGVLGAHTRHLPPFAVAAGIGIGAAVLQLVQSGRGTNWLGGNGSTAAFLAALGIGFGALWYAGRNCTVAAGSPDADPAQRPPA